MSNLSFDVKNVYVKQYINRIANTGRKMFSVQVKIFNDLGVFVLNTYWSDMPYKLPIPVIMRIKCLVSDALKDRKDLTYIKDMLDTFYYWGFPIKQNITDYKRYLLHLERKKRRENLSLNLVYGVNIFGRELPIKRK